MGVTYKLTDDVVQFIIEQKQQSPELSCRELVDLIGLQFQIPVSKSSVHDVLKEAQISSPRGRKVKNKFEIPAEKKAQLLANLPEIVPPRPKSAVPVKANDVKPLPEVPAGRSIALPMPFIPKQMPDILKPLQPGQPEALVDVLLKAAFYDFFPKSTAGLNYQEFNVLPASALKKELQYRATLISGFRLTLEDASSFYIDARFKALSREPAPQFYNAVPIERSLTDMASWVLGNAEPIVVNMIKNFSDPGLFNDFVLAFDGKGPKALNGVALLGPRGNNVVEFNGLAPKINKFILGLEPQAIDYKDLVNIEPPYIKETRSHMCAAALRFIGVNYPWEQGSFRTFLMLDAENKADRIIVSNIAGAVSDEAIIRQYAERAGISWDTSNFARDAIPEGIPDVALGSTPEETLKCYVVDYLMRKRFPGDAWAGLSALMGECRENEQFFLQEYAISEAATQFNSLSHAAEAVNALALRDDKGRQIRIVITPLKN